MSKCSIQGCQEPVDTEADKSYDSVLTKNDQIMIAMYPSKKCDHGLCYYHGMKEWFKKTGIGREN